MRDLVTPITVIVESPAQFEQAYTLYVPVEWEQNREEVRFAIVCHRYACLKSRKLSREQAAIDWTTQPGWAVAQFFKEHQAKFAGFLFLVYTGAFSGSILLLAKLIGWLWP